MHRCSHLRGGRSGSSKVDCATQTWALALNLIFWYDLGYRIQIRGSDMRQGDRRCFIWHWCPTPCPKDLWARPHVYTGENPCFLSKATSRPPSSYIWRTRSFEDYAPSGQVPIELELIPDPRPRARDNSGRRSQQGQVTVPPIPHSRMPLPGGQGNLPSPDPGTIHEKGFDIQPAPSPPATRSTSCGRSWDKCGVVSTQISVAKPRFDA